MNLKQYQTDTLSVLRRFFEEARMAGPKNAYESITQEPEQAMRLGGYAGAYVPLKELFDVPCVCLRLPTGGGKTILAAHAVSVARNAWIEKDYPVVLWLVPTNTIRQQERNSVYQRYLFTPESKVSVSFDDAFTFVDGMYQDQRCYRGRWKPRKHFLGPDRVPAFDGVEDGEEAQCAQVIDSLAEVKYWIRNVARHSQSFYLPTATDKFYPDFVAQLKGGRLFVVEYKGAHIAEGADTAEKRTIGALWEQESDGKGLFIIAEKIVDGKDVRQQLMEKIGDV